MNLALDLQGLRNAIKRSLTEWASHHGVYKDMWARMAPDTRSIAFDAIDEMGAHKPGTFEVWWATHHNRYVRRPGCTQKQMSLLHEVFFAYLGAFARGELLSGDAGTGSEDAEERAPRRKAKGRR